MDEAGIASRLFEIVRQRLQVQGGGTVEKIVVRCGKLELIDRNALVTSWRQVCAGTELENSPLELHLDTAVARCQMCRNEFELEPYTRACPRCRCEQFSIVHQPPVLESLFIS